MAEKHAVDELIDSDRVMIMGPIVAEVLQGFRRQDQANWVAPFYSLTLAPF